MERKNHGSYSFGDFNVSLIVSNCVTTYRKHRYSYTLLEHKNPSTNGIQDGKMALFNCQALAFLGLENSSVWHRKKRSLHRLLNSNDNNNPTGLFGNDVQSRKEKKDVKKDWEFMMP